MHFDPQDLSPEETYAFFISAMVPRPIALVSTVGAAGVLNAAPYSFANGVCGRPPMVGFSAGQRRHYETGELSLKDTPRNVADTGDFVVNIVDNALAETMNASSADFPPEVSEFDECGFTPAAAEAVQSPRIAEAPVNLECRLEQVVELGEPLSQFIIGRVVHFHIRDELIKNGAVDPHRLQAVGRLGGNLYCRVNDIFEMIRPA